MLIFVLECAFYCCVFIGYCSGAPLESQPANNTKLDNGVGTKGKELEELYGLLNRTVIQKLVENHSNITRGLPTDQLNQLLAFGKPLAEKQLTSSITANKSQISNVGPGWQSSVTEAKLPWTNQNSSRPEVFMTFFLIPSFTFENNSQNARNPPQDSVSSLESRLNDAAQATKMSPLEYQPHKPTFAGEFSAGRPGQLVPPGKPWPSEATTQQVIEDRFKETTATPTNTTVGGQLPSFAGEFSAGRPGQLEYQPHKPTFAGEFSAGRPGQLVPPGKPWPSEATTQQVIEDRFKGTTATPTNTTVGGQRPSFAGGFSAGRPGQLIPPGKPLPADPPPISLPTLEDRFQEMKPNTAKDRQPSGVVPFFAGVFSNGRPGQLIPSGKPWPADP